MPGLCPVLSLGGSSQHGPVPGLGPDLQGLFSPCQGRLHGLLTYVALAIFFHSAL